MVYKLVERDGLPVAKTATGKHDHGGRKTISRELRDGVAVADVVRTGSAPPLAAARPLHVPLVRAGERVDTPSLDAARARAVSSLGELPREARQLSQGEPAVATRFE